jgi:hypothetical protein
MASDIQSSYTSKPYSMRLSDVFGFRVTACIQINIAIGYIAKPYSICLSALCNQCNYLFIYIYKKEKSNKYIYIGKNIFFYIYITTRKKRLHGYTPLRASSGADFRVTSGLVTRGYKWLQMDTRAGCTGSGVPA